MRWLIWLLLLVNVVVFAWNSLAVPERVALSDDVGNVRLLSEVNEADLLKRHAVQARPVTKRAQWCVVLSGIDSQVRAQFVMDELRRQDEVVLLKDLFRGLDSADFSADFSATSEPVAGGVSEHDRQRYEVWVELHNELQTISKIKLIQQQMSEQLGLSVKKQKKLCKGVASIGIGD